MKKNFYRALLVFFILGSASVQFAVHAEPDQWYKTEVTVVYIEGEWYAKSMCTDIPGSSCNMPGSCHLIVFPSFW